MDARGDASGLGDLSKSDTTKREPTDQRGRRAASGARRSVLRDTGMEALAASPMRSTKHQQPLARAQHLEPSSGKRTVRKSRRSHRAPLRSVSTGVMPVAGRELPVSVSTAALRLPKSPFIRVGTAPSRGRRRRDRDDMNPTATVCGGGRAGNGASVDGDDDDVRSWAGKADSAARNAHSGAGSASKRSSLGSDTTAFTSLTGDSASRADGAARRPHSAGTIRMIWHKAREVVEFASQRDVLAFADVAGAVLADTPKRHRRNFFAARDSEARKKSPSPEGSGVVQSSTTDSTAPAGRPGNAQAGAAGAPLRGGDGTTTALSHAVAVARGAVRSAMAATSVDADEQKAQALASLGDAVIDLARYHEARAATLQERARVTDDLDERRRLEGEIGEARSAVRQLRDEAEDAYGGAAAMRRRRVRVVVGLDDPRTWPPKEEDGEYEERLHKVVSELAWEAGAAVDVLSKLAQAHVEDGSPAAMNKARLALEEARDVHRFVLGGTRDTRHTPLHYAHVLGALGEVHVFLGRDGDAELCLLESLTVQQGVLQQLEEKHRRAGAAADAATDVDMWERYVRTLVALGGFFTRGKRFRDALPLYRLALQVHEEHDIPDAVQEALLLNNLGLCYTRTDAPDAALEAYEGALRILHGVDADDRDDAAVASLLHNVGTLHRSNGSGKRAEFFLEQAEDLRAKALGTDSMPYARTISVLCDIWLERDEFDRAATALERIRRTQVVHLGDQSPIYRYTLDRLVRCYSILERWVALEDVLVEIVEIVRDGKSSTTTRGGVRRAHGPPRGNHHPMYADALCRLGDLYLSKMREPERAMPLFKEAHDIYMEKLGPRHERTVQCEEVFLPDTRDAVQRKRRREGLPPTALIP